jgi:hypothetical protein
VLIVVERIFQRFYAGVKVRARRWRGDLAPDWGCEIPKLSAGLAVELDVLAGVLVNDPPCAIFLFIIFDGDDSCDPTVASTAPYYP